jgi:hypothetical protein
MNLKIILLIHLIFGVLCENIIIENSEVESVSRALREVAEEFYIKNHIQFDIVAVSDNSKKFSQVINHLIPQIKAVTTHRLSSFTKYLDRPFAIINSYVILSDSCEDFIFISYKFIFGNRFTATFKFLIYIEDCEFDILENQIENFIRKPELTFLEGSIEQYAFLLINDGDILKLATIEWFTEAACNQAQLKVLNSFNKITQKWTNELENYLKFQDFHGCNLTLWIAPTLEYSLYSNIYREIPFGIVPHIFQIISNKFKYSPKFQRFEVENERRAEVCFDMFRQASEFENRLHHTASFMEIRDIILVTPGDLYTAYEKLLLPFDDLTWKLLLLTFFAAFLVIFVVNRMSKSVQHVVYGVNVYKPALNVISTFFGIPQYKVPNKFFSMCIFIIFVFFCLIFRTCYQSKLFQFMTSEPRRPPPKSIQDLTDGMFTMYTTYNSKHIEKMIMDDKLKW